MPLNEVEPLYWTDYSVLSDTSPESVLHDPETGSENAISDEQYSSDDDVRFRERGMCVCNDDISHSGFSGLPRNFELSTPPRNLSQGTVYGCVCIRSTGIVS